MELERPEWLTDMAGVLETLNDGVLIRDDCNHVLFVNGRFSEMTGLTPDEVLGRPTSQFYSGADQEFLLKTIASAEKIGHYRFEFYLPRKDGGRVPVMMSGRTIEDPDGRLYVVVTFADISEQKQAQENLKEANTRLEERQHEIELELQLAERVQQSLAPKALRWGHVGVETFYLPVRSIGGDFGLVSPAGEDQLNLLICDVSGHGISSALVANRIYAETLSQLERGVRLGDMVRQLNRFVLQHLHTSGFFFTLAAARLEDKGHRLTFAGGGHPPGMILEAGGGLRLLSSQSMILGTFENAVPLEASEEVQLASGDRVVLYSDGLTDVFDRRGEILGIEGLQEIVHSAARRSFAEMKDAILGGIENWRHGPPSDDMSLVLVEVR